MQTATSPRATSTAMAATERRASFMSGGLVATDDGLIHRGVLRGAPVDAEGDLIFTTSATGWGEILTDPSFAGQIVVLTHPMVGNYRLDPDELESARVHARALIATRLVTPPAGPGRTLEETATEAGIPVLVGIDTRALTLQLRRGASRRAVIRSDQTDEAAAVAAAAASVPWDGVDHVASVSTPVSYRLAAEGTRRGLAVLLDYGVKRSLLRALTARGMEVLVLPHDADGDAVAALQPDLVVLSPGPGDPSRMAAQIATVLTIARRAAVGGPAVLGVCLGHQLLALAAGARTRRLAVGHHGGNHAVLHLDQGRVDIGAHNHEIEVLDDEALALAGYRVSHRDLNDGTVEGLTHASGRIASVQFHPEGAPGPTDASWILDLVSERAVA